MALELTQSAWTVTTEGEGAKKTLICRCTVLPATDRTDAFTLKTPAALDPRKPWMLGLIFSGTPDGQALPVDLWVGYDSTAALTGDSSTTLVATKCAEYRTIMDDCRTAVAPLTFIWQMDPSSAVADVVTVAAIATGLKVKVPVAPYYILNLDGGSTLAAETATWTIIQ